MRGVTLFWSAVVVRLHEALGTQNRGFYTGAELQFGRVKLCKSFTPPFELSGRPPCALSCKSGRKWQSACFVITRIHGIDLVWVFT